MKLALLRALAALAVLAPVGEALAYQETFVPSIRSSRQPWEEGHDNAAFGSGQAVGRAVFPGGERLLVVTSAGVTQVYVVGRTKLRDAAGRPLGRDQFLEGDEIRVDYDVRGNTNIARQVTVVAPPLPTP